MIASPGDVALERQAARDVIHEWNAIHSSSRKMVLMPVGWETHSHPSMEGRPQGILNKQILSTADLLVAIFWTRIGTPTGEAASGSVEEIEKHIKAGKPAMIYFSSEPVKLDSVDDAQYNALKEFKEQLRKRGLYETYEDRQEFANKFRRQLATKINDDVFFRVAPPSGDRTAAVIDATAAVIDAAAKRIPTMSEEARTLLVEASLDRGGNILHVKFIGGEEIQTNGKQFIQDGDARSRAIWVSALSELSNLGLVRDLGWKGEVYELTREGFDVAEVLQS
ncbi:MAG: hypothetical protein QOF14_2160 [Hyphomicrobiales bacterium]|nr:hypothetical protein [Hyphomicrobiales bacterium]